MAATHGFVTVRPDARYGDSYGSATDGTVSSWKATTPAAESVLVSEIGIYGYSAESTLNVRFALFTHDAVNNCPEALVSGSETGVVVFTSTPGIYYATYETPIELSGETVYWLAATEQGGTLYLSRFVAGSSLLRLSEQAYPAWPTAEQWESSTPYSPREAAFYAVYAEPGGSSPVAKIISAYMGGR